MAEISSGRPLWGGSFPPGEQGVVTGQLEDEASGDVVTLQLKISSGIIVAARYRAFGCPWTIQAAMWAAEWVEGETLFRADAVVAARMSDETSVPADRRYCLELVQGCLQKALAAGLRENGITHPQQDLEARLKC